MGRSSISSDTTLEDLDHLLKQEEGSVEDLKRLRHDGHKEKVANRYRSLLDIFCVFQFFFSLGLIFLLIRANQAKHDPSLTLYSPLNDLVEYIPHRFNRSRGADKTPFQGWPTDEIDRTWLSAYAPGILSSLTPSQASLLPDTTTRIPVPGRENEYQATVDVFHQMHCLDVVRMALYRNRYDKHFYFQNGTVDECKWVHVDHCLDQVRQALMCSADISMVPYQWSDVVQGTRPMVNNMHTCRNYTKILEWAKERALGTREWHPSRRVVEGKNGELRIEKGRNHALHEGEGECNAI